ncbi:hypothetical protein JZ751_002146, partial [Albula glossodonta]
LLAPDLPLLPPPLPPTMANGEGSQQGPGTANLRNHPPPPPHPTSHVTRMIRFPLCVSTE